MSVLICAECLQVPFVEFLPGLMVKFSCHEKNMIRHMDLDKIIENLFTLKCSKKNCQKKAMISMFYCPALYVMNV